MNTKSSMDTVLSISGMTCSGCANTVARVLSRTPGVVSADVDFASGRAVIRGSAHLEELIAAVQAAGYGARLAQNAGEQNEHGRSGCC